MGSPQFSAISPWLHAQLLFIYPWLLIKTIQRDAVNQDCSPKPVSMKVQMLTSGTERVLTPGTWIEEPKVSD